MRAITAAEFRKAVEGDPGWAARLKAPLTVVDYCDMDGTNISALSHHLIFKGRNAEGNCASFRGCRDLTAGEGTFHGFVDFGPLEKTVDGEVVGEPCGISDLQVNILAPNIHGEALNISYTESVTHLTGKYPGHVEACGSEVASVDIEITAPNLKGKAASFQDCPSIGLFNGKLAGSLDLTGATIRRWGNIEIGAKDRENKKVWVGGTNIKKIAGEISLTEEEIGGLEGSSIKFIRAISGRNKNILPQRLENEKSWEPDPELKAPGAKITKETVANLIKLLRASSLKARETRVGYLSQWSYKETREKVKAYIDWDEGGVQKEHLESIQESGKFEAHLPELEKASRDHRKYTRRLKEVAVAMTNGKIMNQGVLRYYDPMTKGLTERGDLCFKESIKAWLPEEKPECGVKLLTTAEIFARDNQLAQRNKSPSSPGRINLMRSGVVGSMIIGALAYMCLNVVDTGLERQVSNPLWDWVEKEKPAAVELIKSWVRTGDPNVLGKGAPSKAINAVLLEEAIAPDQLEARRVIEERTQRMCGNPAAVVTTSDALESVLGDFRNMDRILGALRAGSGPIVEIGATAGLESGRINRPTRIAKVEPWVGMH